MAILWTLFITFFHIGLLCFGGGYAVVQLAQDQTVNVHGWLTLQEFSELLTVSEMTPGPLALNAASFVGAKMAGWPGAITATIGLITPAWLITSILAYLYKIYRDSTFLTNILQGVRPIVLGMLSAVVVTFIALAFQAHPQPKAGYPWWEYINWLAVPVVPLLVWLLKSKRLGPIGAILLAGSLGIVVRGLGF